MILDKAQEIQQKISQNSQYLKFQSGLDIKKQQYSQHFHRQLMPNPYQTNHYDEQISQCSQPSVQQQKFSNILRYNISSPSGKYFSNPIASIENNYGNTRSSIQKQSSSLVTNSPIICYHSNIYKKFASPETQQQQLQSDLSFAIYNGLTQAKKQVYINQTAQTLHKLLIKQLQLQIQMCKQLQGLTMMSMLRFKEEEARQGIKGIQGEIQGLKEKIGGIQRRYGKNMGNKQDQEISHFIVDVKSFKSKEDNVSISNTNNKQIKYNIINTVNGRIKITKNNCNLQQNINTNTNAKVQQKQSKYLQNNITSTTPSLSRTGSYLSTHGVVSSSGQTQEQRYINQRQQKGYLSEQYQQQKQSHNRGIGKYKQQSRVCQQGQLQQIGVLEQKINVMKNSIFLTKNYYRNRQQLIQRQIQILKQQLNLTNTRINGNKISNKLIQNNSQFLSQPQSPYLRAPLTPTLIPIPSSSSRLQTQIITTPSPSPSTYMYTPTNCYPYSYTNLNTHTHAHTYTHTHAHAHTYTKIQQPTPASTSRQRYPRLKSQSIVRRQSRSRGKLFKVKTGINGNQNNQYKLAFKNGINDDQGNKLENNDYQYQHGYQNEYQQNSKIGIKRANTDMRKQDSAPIILRYGSLNKFNTLPNTMMGEQDNLLVEPKLKLKPKYKPKHKYSNRNDKYNTYKSRQSKSKINHHNYQYNTKNMQQSSTTPSYLKNHHHQYQNN